MTQLEIAVQKLLPAVEKDPLVRVVTGPGGHTTSAAAIGRIEASPARVWKVLTEVDRYAERVPLIDKVKIRGDVVDFGLRFRVSFFSVGFSFETSLREIEGRRLTLSYRSGEPKDIVIDYLVEPIAEAPGSTALAVHIGFDVDSIGWLARYFLKHHPEIKHGVHAGCALALFDSMRRAA